MENEKNFSFKKILILILILVFSAYVFLSSSKAGMDNYIKNKANSGVLKIDSTQEDIIKYLSSDDFKNKDVNSCTFVRVSEPATINTFGFQNDEIKFNSNNNSNKENYYSGVDNVLLSRNFNNNINNNILPLSDTSSGENKIIYSVNTSIDDFFKRFDYSEIIMKDSFLSDFLASDIGSSVDSVLGFQAMNMPYGLCLCLDGFDTSVSYSILMCDKPLLVEPCIIYSSSGSYVSYNIRLKNVPGISSSGVDHVTGGGNFETGERVYPASAPKSLMVGVSNDGEKFSVFNTSTSGFYFDSNGYLRDQSNPVRSDNDAYFHGTPVAWAYLDYKDSSGNISALIPGQQYSVDVSDGVLSDLAVERRQRLAEVSANTYGFDLNGPFNSIDWSEVSVSYASASLVFDKVPTFDAYVAPGAFLWNSLFIIASSADGLVGNNFFLDITYISIILGCMSLILGTYVCGAKLSSSISNRARELSEQRELAANQAEKDSNDMDIIYASDELKRNDSELKSHKQLHSNTRDDYNSSKK